MTEATILIPTFRHAEVLPFAIRSALAQEGFNLELFVVGDGVEDDTRAAVEPFLADPRVRFFDFPKGERNGERNRHEALREARGDIICYLSDDDLLLPGYLQEMSALLVDADFAHPPPLSVHPDGRVEYRPADFARPEFFSLMSRGLNNFVSLTGASHTRAAYDRLPEGWRPAPPDVGSDIHMWRQFLGLSAFRAVTGKRMTTVHFPNPEWRLVDQAERAAVLAHWFDIASAPGGRDELDKVLEAAIRVAAQDFKLRSIELQRRVEAVTRAEQARLRARIGRAARRIGRR
jgi:GalNAc5-diNAcBac-PP-undecaprenol beta-1,3-glucosyltransferase